MDFHNLAHVCYHYLDITFHDSAFLIIAKKKPNKRNESFLHCSIYKNKEYIFALYMMHWQNMFDKKYT